MTEQINVIFDINIYVSVAEATGPFFDDSALTHWIGKQVYPESNRLRAFRWGLRGRAGELSLHVFWSDHIRTNIEIHTKHLDWTSEDLSVFLTLIDDNLISKTGGRLITPSPQGFAYMGSADDSKVFENARTIANTGITFLVSDDGDFIRLAKDYHEHATGAARNIMAVNTVDFCNFCDISSHVS